MNSIQTKKSFILTMVLFLAAFISLTGNCIASDPPAGMIVWFKADAGVTTDPNGFLSWQDQSGYDNDANRVTGDPKPAIAAFPAGDLPVIRFNGGDGLGLANGAALMLKNFRVFVVSRHVGTGNEQRIFGNYSTGGNIYGWIFSTTAANAPDWWYPAQGIHMSTGFPYEEGESYFTATTYNAKETHLKVLYTFKGTKGFNGYATQILGGSPLEYDIDPDSTILTTIGVSWDASTEEWSLPFTGDIAEILVYDMDSTQLTDPENLFQNVRSYITEKYGINTALGGGGDVDPDPLIDAELAAYWTFDETSGTVLHDITTNANHGILQNGFTFDTNKTEDRHGNPTGALSFNGSNDRIRVEHSESIDCYPGVTVAAWVKTAQPQTNAYATVVSKDIQRPGWNKYNGYQIGTFTPPNSGGLVQLGSYLACSDQVYYGCMGTLGAIVNDWQHIAVTHTGVNGKITLYLDGVEHASVPVPYGLDTTSPGHLLIGANVEFGRPWAGAIDEVAIWKGALTAGEIYYVYLSGVPYQTCQTNGVYFAGDVNRDCYVDLADFVQIVEDWLKCNDPTRPECTDIIP